MIRAVGRKTIRKSASGHFHLSELQRFQTHDRNSKGQFIENMYPANATCVDVKTSMRVEFNL
jgi:hypothetical protein